jgi:hypothetical protein
MRRKLRVAAAIAGSLLMAACGTVKIGRINADPSRFQNRAVRIDGRVVTSAGLLGRGVYQVEDNTGRIYVISSTGVPSGGSRVSVTGTVIGGAQVMGRPVGTTIREQHHRLK